MREGEETCKKKGKEEQKNAWKGGKVDLVVLGHHRAPPIVIK